MNEKRKAAHGAGTPGRHAETWAYSRASTSIDNDSTNITSGQPGKIEKLLSYGAENAVPLKHLATITWLPARQVRLMIQEERLRGAQILADNEHGYFLPGSETDVDNFVRSMLHRAHEIARVANAVRLRGRRLD